MNDVEYKGFVTSKYCRGYNHAMEMAHAEGYNYARDMLLGMVDAAKSINTYTDFDAGIERYFVQNKALEPQEVREPWKCGLLFRWGSLWVGAHWFGKNKQLCVNLLPFVTFWITAPGGVMP